MVLFVLEGIEPDKTPVDFDFASGVSVEAIYEPASGSSRIEAAYGLQTLSHCRDAELSEGFFLVLCNFTDVIVHMIANYANTRRVSGRRDWPC